MEPTSQVMTMLDNITLAAVFGFCAGLSWYLTSPASGMRKRTTYTIEDYNREHPRPVPVPVPVPVPAYASARWDDMVLTARFMQAAWHTPLLTVSNRDYEIVLAHQVQGSVGPPTVEGVPVRPINWKDVTPNPRRTWKTKDGTVLHVSHMKDSHLEHTIAYLDRTDNNIHSAYSWLVEEEYRREEERNAGPADRRKGRRAALVDRKDPARSLSGSDTNRRPHSDSSKEKAGRDHVKELIDDMRANRKAQASIDDRG